MEDLYLLTVTEVAKILKTDKNTVYDLIHCGFIIPTTLGRIKVSNKELNRFICAYEGQDVNALLAVEKAKTA